MKHGYKLHDVKKLTGLSHHVKLDKAKMYWKKNNLGRYYQNSDLRKHPAQMFL
jgi:hypothetical protein